MKQMIKRMAPALATILLVHAQPAFAQDNTVTLESPDGLFQVTGELSSFDDNFYIVSTAIGEISVARESVGCTGAACPTEVAEASSEIVLTSGDGSFFVGDLVSFNGVNYVIDTAIGELTIRSEFVTCEGEACPSAEQMADFVDTSIKLTAGDGTSFEGNLVDFNGTDYIINTALGELTIRSEFVSCEGEACPDLTPDTIKFSIASPAGVGERFVGDALRRFASEKGLSVTRSISGAGETIVYLLGDDLGNLVAQIEVVPAGDIASIYSLFTGSASFALTREPFVPSALAQASGLNQARVNNELTNQTIALDALTTHTHPENRVRSISITDMGDILSGRISNWAEIGGADAAINVHVLDPASNLARIIARDILDPRRLSITPDAIVHPTLEALNEAVASDPAGFAMSYRSEADINQSITTRNACNMFSTANAFSLQTEEYPLTMRWHLYAPKDTSALPDMANAVMEYLLSDAGQEAAKASGLVGLEIAREPMRNQGERLLSAMLSERLSNQVTNAYRGYLAEVSSADRLSPTLRFLTGSSQLDARALRDIDRIAALLTDHETMDGNKVLLIGFSDSVGNFGGNINLSRSRAAQVKELILQKTLGFLTADDIVTLGFGPAAPVGCNSTPQGRDLNRRVEVWIRGANIGTLQTN